MLDGDSATGSRAAQATAAAHASAAAALTTGGAAGTAVPMAASSTAACLRPLSLVDVRVARELCAEYGVAMALAGTRAAAPGCPCLWVDPRSLNTLRCLDDGLPSSTLGVQYAHAGQGPGLRFRAAPGVTMATLAQAGLTQFAGLPAGLTVAAWLAGREHVAVSPGLACPPGLVSVDVMLADGALETLGPFGASGGVPLRSGTGQALIPALYTLSTRAGAAWCRAQAAWPARYRLDALTPPAPAEANLAGLLAGHEGALAWVDSVVLQAVTPSDSGGQAGVADMVSAESVPYAAQARALDANIKDAFDPAGLYPEAPLP
ncbi:hypothetical protein [Bordetella sp. LUAb4]|uniref:hypothetical protein n=1 Tax=Bordetella sp. LUAb4 TaxID=2843195 RepID=UPI001E2D41E5